MMTYRETMVLLHAFPLTSSMWDGERRELSHHINVLTPDLSGFGSSGRQKKPSIAGMAQEVGALLDHLGISQPVVIGGLSMGGYVAFEFLRQFPDRVRGLMLFSTRATPDTAETYEKRFRAIEEIEKSGIESFAAEIRTKLIGKTSLRSRHKAADEVLAMILANEPEGLKDALRAMAWRCDASDLLAKISCPCLVVAGEEDGIVAPSEMEAMHGKIPGSEFYKVPKAGHLVNIERPDIFITLVEHFLETRILGHEKTESGEEKEILELLPVLKQKGIIK